MKHGRYISLLLCACLLPALAGSAFAAHHLKDESGAGEVRKEAAQTLDALKHYGAQQRDEAVAAAKELLGKLDAKIDALQDRVDTRWEKLSESAKAETKQTLKELRKQRLEAAERLGSLKASSAGAWDEIKKGFSSSVDALSTAISRAAGEFDNR